MKSLLVLRHAKSSWAEPGLADHDRPLNQRGKSDAPRVGELLQEQGLIPDLILSSTAKRARKTAERVARHCGYDREVETVADLYLAAPASYLEALRIYGEQHDRVMVVGHNPGIEDLVELLTGEFARMSTAALAHIQLDIESWSNCDGQTNAKLLNVWRPKEL